MIYGSLHPDTWSELDFKGTLDYAIPTVAGVVVITNHFTGTFHSSFDPPGKSGTFDGDHTSGRFWLRPIEGDSIHSPLTRVEAGWISTWHSERTSNATDSRVVHGAETHVPESRPERRIGYPRRSSP